MLEGFKSKAEPTAESKKDEDLAQPKGVFTRAAMKNQLAKKRKTTVNESQDLNSAIQMLKEKEIQNEVKYW